MNTFTKKMTQTYISATVASMITDSVVAGLNGTKGGLNFGDLFLSGLQGGTYYIAYPLALEILKNHCKKFRDYYNDPERNHFVEYCAAGALGAGIVTFINYPLSIIQASRAIKMNEKMVPTFSGFMKSYFCQVPKTITFAATMGTLCSKIPTPKHPFALHMTNHAYTAISDFSCFIVSYPINKAMGAAPPLFYGLKEFIRNVPFSMLTDDSFERVMKITNFISE